MGKKSQKKKPKDKMVRRKPDEVIHGGALRVERYGNHILYSNNSTPEQHANFIKRTKEVNEKILIDLERELIVLQNLVSKYDPVELMHRAAYMIMPLFMKYRSEGEFQYDESYFLPTVEYIQYLIARTEPNTDGKELSESEWEEIWSQAMKVLHLTQSHLLARGTLTNPPTEIDSLRFMLDTQRLIVRGKRYPLFFKDHLRSSLAPYEQQIKEIYNVGVEEIIEGLVIIDNYQKTGILGRYQDVQDITDAFTDKLRAKGYAVDPGATPEEIKRTQAAFETEEFKTMHDEMQEKMRLTFTSAIFEITDLTTLPKQFLTLLSVRPGESILKTLTGPNHDDLSPLSNSVLHYKPFLEVGGKFYTFYHSGFDDHISDIIEADLFEKRPTQISEMAKRRSNGLESDTNKLLSSILNPDFAYQNVYYPNPDDSGSLTELDILVGVDDILFLVEAKAGGFSAGASRGAPESMAEGFSDLIIEGQRQSERAERYIRSCDEVSFFDESGQKEVQRIRQLNYRKIIRVVITREELGWVGAKIAVLSILDPGLSNSYPWHVSIGDLRIIAELFKDDEVRFIHYLELRLLASAETILEQNDEIEHIGLYNKINYYHELPVQGTDRLTYDPSYMRDIDHYFRDRILEDNPPVPTQDMPEKMRKFISALRISRLPHRFEVGALILSMDSEGRQEFENSLDVLDQGDLIGKQRTVRLPFTARKIGFSVTYNRDSNLMDELRKSAVQMNQGKCERWFVVQITNKNGYKILGIELITPDRFSETELINEMLRHEEKALQVIKKEKTGRNEQCPCGSGKKFKRCHGAK